MKKAVHNLRNKKIASFTDLVVWQNGHEFVAGIYQVIQGFPQEEICGLADQIRRTVVSTRSNFAEGSGRQTLKESPGDSEKNKRSINSQS